MTTTADAQDPRTDRELALWMLEQMRESEAFLAMLRAARRQGRRDILDTREDIEPHRKRLGVLFDGDEDVIVGDAPPRLVSVIEEVMARDLLSGREEFLEQALAAYLEQHPRGSEGLPIEWQTTIEAARDEIEGRTEGAFEAGFIGKLAAAAREEIARSSEHDREHDNSRGRAD
jgi:hypothetical protein